MTDGAGWQRQYCAISDFARALAMLVALIGLLLPAAASAEFGLMVPSPPSVSTVAPVHITQGQTVTVTLRGANLRPGLSVDFGPGVQIQSSLSIVDATSARATIRVDANAPPGPRSLRVTFNGQGIGGPRMIVDAAPRRMERPGLTTPPERGGFTRTVPPAPTSNAVPRVSSVFPYQLQRGSTVHLTLHGEHFATAMALDFGPGIQLDGALQVQGAAAATATVHVAADAPLSRRLVVASRDGHRSTGPATVVVQAAAPGGGFAAPPPVKAGGGFLPAKPVAPVTVFKLTGIEPKQLVAGHSYPVLELKGDGFKNGMRISLGSGIALQGDVQVQDARHARIAVVVSKSAVVGPRQSRAAPGAQGALQQQPAMVSVTPPKTVMKVSLPKPKLPGLNLTTFTKAKLFLEKPEWGWSEGGSGGENKQDRGIPLLDDETRLEWREQNAGLAQWYELRIYAKGSKTPLITRKIGSLNNGGQLPPTYFRPDAAFLKALLSKIGVLQFKQPSSAQATVNQGVATQGVVQQGGGQDLQPSASATGQLHQMSELEQALKKADLSWEVSGYRVYYGNGVAQSAQAQATHPIVLAAAATQTPGAQGKTLSDVGGGVAQTKPGVNVVEVEVSERWPLSMPNKPTGLTCPGTGIKGGLFVYNADKSSTQEDGKATVDLADYVGDRMMLKGDFTLGNSPYASHPEGEGHHDAPGSQINLTPYTSLNFDNIFVDWGDGTIEPLVIRTPEGNDGTFYRDDKFALDVSGFQHRYTTKGDHVVRVFQLSSDDAQKMPPGFLAPAVDGAAADGGDTYAQVAAQSGGPLAGFLQGMNQQAQELAGRAYMVHCETVHISTHRDDDAEGPLHLTGIQVVGFPGQAATNNAASRVNGGTKSGRKANTKPSRSSAASKSSSGVSHALQPSQPSAALQMNAVPNIAQPGPNIDTFSKCDSSVVPRARVSYYGRGDFRLVWRLNGKVIESSEPQGGLGPSQWRDDLGRDPTTWPPPIVTNADFLGNPIAIGATGRYDVSVSAEVIYRVSAVNLSGMVASAFHGNKGAVKGLAGALGRGGPKVGVLSPHRQSVPGLPPVAYANPALTQLAARERTDLVAANNVQVQMPPSLGANAALNRLAGNIRIKKEPPEYVESKPRPYLVVESDPNQPCMFRFPVQGGDFLITGLQNGKGQPPKVTKNGDRYSGSGDLQLRVAGLGDKLIPVPIQFKDWVVPDGLHVKTGSIDVSPGTGTLSGGPGVAIDIEHLKGEAGKTLDATLTLTPDIDLHLAANEELYSWQHVSAPITPDGDWYATGDGVKLPESMIYSSLFRISADNGVALDLSKNDGEASCGGSGAGWMGVYLGPSATLRAPVLDLAKEFGPSIKVSGWSIGPGGFCGTAKFGAHSADLMRGKISFSGIDVKAKGGSFTGTYHNLVVHAPWLDVDLKAQGDTVITETGTPTLAITAAGPSLTQGPIHYQPKNLLLIYEKNVGWAVSTDTTFDFKAEGRDFAKGIAVNRLLFGMDGRAHFDEGATSKSVPVSQTGQLGQTPVTLAGLKVTAPTSGDGRLQLDFDAKLRLSEDPVMPAADAQVTYRIEAPGDNFTGSGPTVGPFSVQMYFPNSQQPTVAAKVHPQYAPGGGSAAVDVPGPLNWIPKAEAASGATRYYGHVDLSMFGGPPVSAEFLLGYQGSKDFWLTRANIGMGQSGVTIVPPFLSLYEIHGGLGHNMALNAFDNPGSIASAPTQLDGSTLFMAGMLVGSPDKFAYMLRGDFTVKTSGVDAGARMKYNAWLLKNSHSGDGDFQGFFQYAGENFDGSLWGGMGFLNGAVSFTIPQGAATMHFGGGIWHINAGTDGNPIKVHVLIADADGYIGIGNEGYKVGGGIHVNLGGDLGPFSAKVHGNVSAGMSITPQPHAEGHANASLKAEACAFGACIGPTVTAGVAMAAAPVDIKAHVCLEIDLVLDSVEGCGNVHL